MCKKETSVNMGNTSGNSKGLNAAFGDALLPTLTDQAPCKNAASFCGEIQKLGNLLSALNSKLKAIEKETNLILNILDERTLISEQSTNPEGIASSVADEFPLKTAAEIFEMNNKINEANKASYIAEVQRLLAGRICKNLKNVFARSLCLELSTREDSVKKPLKDYSRVYDVLRVAVGKTSNDVENEIQKAFQAVKKRHLRAVCRKKNEAVN